MPQTYNGVKMVQTPDQPTSNLRFMPDSNSNNKIDVVKQNFSAGDSTRSLEMQNVYAINNNFVFNPG